MIFGKSKQQREKEFRARLAAEAAGIIKFAYLPVHLTDGRWIWLEHYLKRGRHYLQEIIHTDTSTSPYTRSSRYEWQYSSDPYEIVEFCDSAKTVNK